MPGIGGLCLPTVILWETTEKSALTRLVRLAALSREGRGLVRVNVSSELSTCTACPLPKGDARRSP